MRRLAHDPGDPIITSHCPFCGSGQVVGRSDGTIGCDFCGQNYLVRVQPAFPGIPQMPNGPGAPSDVGPDGVMDPSMIGPDGMPMGGGPTPPGAPGDDAPPFGGDEDDDAAPGGGGDGPPGPPGGGGPPPGGSSKPKPPSKGKQKKESARRYRGIGGALLTEDQFIRHLAANLSGHHPAVMARLRADSALRRRAHSGEHVPLADTAEGMRQHLLEYHGAGPLPGDHESLSKLHDHDHATRDFGWENSPDAAHSPGFIAARGRR